MLWHFKEKTRASEHWSTQILSQHLTGRVYIWVSLCPYWLGKEMAIHFSTLAWKIPWKGVGHSSCGMSLQCSPLLRLKIKVTSLFPLNSISVFFIQLWWAEKVKILASNNIMMAIQLQLYFSGSIAGAGRLYVRRVAQTGHQRTCRWADHNNKNMIKTSEHLPKRNCCKIS